MHFLVSLINLPTVLKERNLKIIALKLGEFPFFNRNKNVANPCVGLYAFLNLFNDGTNPKSTKK
jgi:hypothetical protein